MTTLGVARRFVALPVLSAALLGAGCQTLGAPAGAGGSRDPECRVSSPALMRPDVIVRSGVAYLDAPLSRAVVRYEGKKIVRAALFAIEVGRFEGATLVYAPGLAFEQRSQPITARTVRVTSGLMAWTFEGTAACSTAALALGAAAQLDLIRK